jgi:hypothetical protein
VNQPDYTVGQVLYVVLRKEATVYPMQVVQEIVKKTMEGEVTTYMVRGQDPTKELMITDIDGEVFDSADGVKKVLFERISTSISQRVETAVAKAREWYPTGREIASDDPMALIKKQTTMGVLEAPSPKKRGNVKPIKPELAELAAELSAENDTLMEVPDGQGGTMMAKVKSMKLPGQLQG